MKLIISEKGRVGILIYNVTNGLGGVSIKGSGLISYTDNMIDQYKIKTYECTIDDLTHCEVRQLLSNIEYLNKSPYIDRFIKEKMIKHINIHQRIINYH